MLSYRTDHPPIGSTSQISRMLSCRTDQPPPVNRHQSAPPTRLPSQHTAAQITPPVNGHQLTPLSQLPQSTPQIHRSRMLSCRIPPLVGSEHRNTHESCDMTHQPCSALNPARSPTNLPVRICNSRSRPPRCSNTPARPPLQSPDNPYLAWYPPTPFPLLIGSRWAAVRHVSAG